MIKKSFQYSFAIIAGASAIAGLWGYTVKDINSSWNWWAWGLVLIGAFIFLFVILYLGFCLLKHKPYNTIINGTPVKIIIGDLFAQEGWKVIPFNDRFDMQVDDKIIAMNSLNGILIKEKGIDQNELKNTICEAINDTSKLKPVLYGEKMVFPLGRLIPFKEYLLLSFSHFDDQNVAFLNIGEYEQMLFCMWEEMRRVYAAKPVAIPFIGTGITKIEGVSEKNYTEMLKCILCTFKRSNFQTDHGINIVLTQKTIEKVDMNIIKEEF